MGSGIPGTRYSVRSAVLVTAIPFGFGQAADRVDGACRAASTVVASDVKDAAELKSR
jgi:hypothetical protein